MLAGVAVALVIVGFGLTVADVVPTGEVQLPKVDVKEYTPLAAVVAVGMLGFCRVLEKPFGPVQANVAPLDVPVKFNAEPAQIGPLLLAVAVGVGFTTTVNSLLVALWLVSEQVTVATT